MTRLRFYLPEGRTAMTLAEAISFGEGFVVATESHEIYSYVDWNELDDDQRDELRVLSGRPEKEVIDDLVEACAARMEADPHGFVADVEDARKTLLAWAVKI